MDKKILIGVVTLIVLLIASYYFVYSSPLTNLGNGNPIEKKVSSIINQQRLINQKIREKKS